MEEKDTSKFRLGKVILKVLGIFLAFEVVCQFAVPLIGGPLWKMVLYGKYTTSLLAEAIVLGFALVLLGFSRLLYILKNRNIKFGEAINLGMPILVLSIIMLVSNALSLDTINWSNLLSMIIYTALIGCFEEIFFRGIIETELLKNYSKTKKEAIISIAISALIFGAVHITNVFYGQDVLTTIMQVIQTSAIGFLFGSIYYVSRNIWALAFLHGFYDFSVMLGDVNLIKDCAYVGNVPFYVTFQSLVVSLVLSGIYLLFSIVVLNNSRVKHLLNEEVTEEMKSDDYHREKIINRVIWTLVVGVFAFNIVYSIFFDMSDNSDYYVCYNYEEKKIDNVETHYYSYDNFSLKLQDKEFKVFKENDKAYIENQNTKEMTDLGIDDVDRVVVMDNNIMVLAIEGVNYKLYYSNYMTDENVIDGFNYLDNVKNSFQVFDVPDISSVGYLIDVNNNIKYPMVKSSIYDFFVIEDNNIYIVK